MLSVFLGQFPWCFPNPFGGIPVKGSQEPLAASWRLFMSLWKASVRPLGTFLIWMPLGHVKALGIFGGFVECLCAVVERLVAQL